MNIKITKKSNALYYLMGTKQDNSLQSFLNTLQNKNLDVLFFQNSTRKILTNFFDKKEVDLFYNNYKIFNSHNQINWQSCKHTLLTWKNYFKNNEKIINKLMAIEYKLLNIKSFKLSTTPIYLVLNNNQKEMSAWYSISKNDKFIVIEVPFNKKPDSKDLFPCAILLHEFFHLLIRQNNDLFQTLNNFSKDVNSQQSFEELLISSFIPEGYLGQNCLNIKKLNYNSKHKDLLNQRRYIADQMYKYAEKYIETSGQLDKQYFQLIKKLPLT